MRIKIPVTYDGVPPREDDVSMAIAATEPRALTPVEETICARPAGARPRGHARDRRARSGGSRSAVPRRGLGRRQRDHRDATGADERRRERDGEPRTEAPRESARHSAGCPSPEEHRHHRGDPRKGDRQVREAGGRHRLADSGDQPVRDADRHRDLRHQVQGCGDLFAASRAAGRRRTRRFA